MRNSKIHNSEQQKLISFDNNNDVGDENKAGQALKDLSLAYNESLRPESDLQSIKDFYFTSDCPFLKAWCGLTAFLKAFSNKYLIFYEVGM